jgi:hypothetical protein
VGVDDKVNIDTRIHRITTLGTDTHNLEYRLLSKDLISFPKFLDTGIFHCFLLFYRTLGILSKP